MAWLVYGPVAAAAPQPALSMTSTIAAATPGELEVVGTDDVVVVGTLGVVLGPVEVVVAG
jgi:hypothetical protein